ncbi:DUF551 domain-containing protein [Enterobacter hormaechei]|uniref:DUF551 domain-containing protein n=1 Tax=Enterobacter hormaechei TaxID=158836 RepID=UPI00084CB835|nr:DUF551 domain-containing protein [Enterobacter hormaechei]AOP82313.1 hypothetical protein BFV66_09910 [Enterobacter hormaechei subsp. oharae]AOP83510.1 hypothetical protein BFV66_16265 [Enterobacter hormaechei subsp. oharae]UBH30923.1 DUF551 domain-containing protein [Enterobacter hormaechei subsp. oharae]UBH33934.1 DUF551 domain-containing protein [Enterobacter hormaechei subsp. oharae]
MSTITKQAVQAVADLKAGYTLGHADVAILNELARIALASLEAEPVALRDERSGSGGISKKPGFNDLQHGTPLYTAPPAPVSVPDERYQHLSELYHAQEKRLFKLAQRIKGASFDKYAYSPSQAIDVLESAIFGEREDECRAAMLQGAEQQQNQQQNIPENIPGTLFKPVADLYGITSPTGSETSFTFDAVEARDFIDGGWLCQEYVELERFQEAITNHTEDKLAMVDHSGDSNNMVESVTTACELRDAVDAIRNSGIAIDGEKILAERDALNSPVIPDGWVACSERMPEQFKAILAFNEYGEVWSGAYDRYWNFYCDNLLVEHVTHWMPLPNPPKE